MSTESYEKKRNFHTTPEPRGGSSSENEQPIFVIQEHDASSHHFDFRIEVDGTLKSWAVPKGPSTDPSEKRLAVPTEDHPLDYADFEGVIPEDEYGGGTVIIWDRGPYENITEKDGDLRAVTDSLKEGHLLIRLHGEKLQGGYALQRFRDGDDDEDEQWLLIKMDDDEADARRNPVSTEPKSVTSGRTIDEVTEAERDED